MENECSAVFPTKLKGYAAFRDFGIRDTRLASLLTFTRGSITYEDVVPAMRKLYASTKRSSASKPHASLDGS